MEFEVLGSVRIRGRSRSWELTGRMQRTLLSVLLARANRPVSVAALTEAVWSGQPDARSASKLQLHMHKLRRMLDEPDRLMLVPEGYRLRVLPGELDAERFESLVGEAEDVADQEPERAVGLVRKALELWRGTPYSGLDLSLLADEAHRLPERRLAALELLYEAELRRGRHAAVVLELIESARLHPLRERLHGLLMIALYRGGRQAEALEVYRAARRTIIDELGLEPGPDLRRIEQQILAGESVGFEAGAPHSTPAQLPHDIRGFVGRESELSELDDLAAGEGETPALISAVAGTAGVGKTALAVWWAHRARARFPDGQLYVDLRGYGPQSPVSPEDALAGFLRALGVEGAAIPQDLAERAARFRTLLDGRRMLVVLDNARTVDQVRPLLPGTGSCFVLVTSRDSLTGLAARDGAHRVRLDRLPVADAHNLVRIQLGERADIEPDATRTLISRCARLPLALRIAAELIKTRPGMSVADLVTELTDEQERLDLLDIGGDPHTAVRAVFSWSYQQLDAPVARVFRLIGLHPGHDTDAHAVAALTGTGLRDTRHALDVLVRVHLVDRTAGGRYQSHDLLRAYAAELAASTDSDVERAVARTRLFDYYLYTASLAMDVIAPHESEGRPRVPAPDREAPTFSAYANAFRWLDVERPTLLAAARQGDQTFVIHLSETVWRYLNIGGYHDDTLTLHTLALDAAHARSDTAAEANARLILGSVMMRLGNHDQALHHLGLALAVYRQTGDQSLQAATLNNLGNVYTNLGELSAARHHFEQALVLYRKLDVRRLQAPAMNNLARNLLSLRRFDEAFQHFERALAIAAENGNRTSKANALCGLAELCVTAERVDEGFAYVRQALEISREIGHRSLESEGLRVLGAAYRRLGEHDLALRHHDSSLTIARAIGDNDLLMGVLNGLAAAHAAAGNPAEALRFHHEVLAMTTRVVHHEECAHAHAGIGDVHAGLGAPDEARGHWQQALMIYRALGVSQTADLVAKLDSAMDAG